MPPLDDAASGRIDRADSDPANQPAGQPAALVPLRRNRDDGWTAERQRDFLAALADTGSVGRAAQAVGMSRESAYRLRRRPGALGFVAAWEAAQDAAVQRLADTCLERAIHGDEVPVYSKGEIIGTRRRYPDALAIFLLRMRDPLRHGPLTDRVDARDRVSRRWKLHDHVRRGLAALPEFLGALRALPEEAGEGEPAA